MQSFIAAGAVFLTLTRFGGGQVTSLLHADVMADTPVVIGLQATEDMGAVTTDDAAVGFLRPGRWRRIYFWMFSLAMLSSEN
jgi:hypothetical protein